MRADQAWKRIEESMKFSSLSRPPYLDTFQKLIRKRFRRKKYGSFRIPEYEEILLQEKSYALLYARCIVMGKLPDNMHRRMLAWAIENPNDSLIREYFEVCEGRRKYERPIWMH